MNDVEFHQLYAARRVIEIGSLRAGRAGGNGRSWIKASPEELEELVALEQLAVVTPRASLCRLFRFHRADAQFHATVMSLAKNPFLEASGRHSTSTSTSHGSTRAGVTDYVEAQLEHGAILEAVIASDYKELILTCQNHIDNSEARLARLVQ